VGRDASATFQATCRGPAGTVPWLDRRIDAAAGEGWRRVTQEVEVPRPCTVVLEASVQPEGEGRDPSRALWGNPRLVFEPPPAERPNLVVIGIDTLRADAVGALGSRDGLTPRLDELARRSLLLSDLTAPSPWTLPSFASLLTGLHPETHGAGERLTTATHLRDVRFRRLSRRLPTLAQVLAGAGYATGSVYGNPFLSPRFGLDAGFDEHRGVPPTAPAAVAVDHALEWVDRQGGRPFFLFLHLLDPHTPYTPPEPFCSTVARRLEGGFGAVPCGISRATEADKRIPVALRPWAAALYKAEVAYTDHQVGRFLDGLRGRGLADRTVLFVTSDHGEELWERTDQTERLGYHAVADHGHTLYRELLRVPGILHIPKQIPQRHRPGRPAETFDRPAELVDLFPTLLALLSLEAPPHQGRDLLARIDRETPPPLRVASFLLYGPERWSASRHAWKLIQDPASGRTELYHLEQDSAERTDLRHEEAEIAAALRTAAGNEMAARRELRHRLLADEGEAAPELDPDELEQLRALGYLN
jgi:arylsulfatase A-like enzyme